MVPERHVRTPPLHSDQSYHSHPHSMRDVPSDQGTMSRFPRLPRPRSNRSRLLRRHLLALLFPAVIFLLPRVSEAAVRTWTGGGLTNNWSEPANWTALPGAGDVATFNATSVKPATIDGNINVAGIAINAGYTGTITQAAGVTVTVGASNFVQATGTFVGGDSAININGAYTLSGGSFTATSGTTTFALGFTHTVGGTFTHNNGTVVFSGVAATINVGTSETFFNLTISKNNGIALTVTNSTTLVVTGTLTLTDGNLNQATIPAAGSIDAQGGVTHGGGFDGGTGRINITGAATRTINLTGGGNLPGVLLNAANVTLNGPASGTTTFVGAGTSFTLQAGTVTGGAGAITFNLAYSQSGGSFTGGAGTVTVTGAFTLSAGSFTGGTTTTLTGAATASGGTLNGGSGTLTFNAAATFSGATVDGQSAAWNFNGAYTLSAGTFTASSGNTTFALGFTHTAGGTFTHNNGTVVFSGVAATINVGTSETFFNLTISKNDGIALTVTNSTTLVVTGTLTLTDGNLNQAIIPAAGSIDAQEGVTHGGGFDGGTGRINIDGAATRTINLTGGGNLPGVLLNAANVTLNGPASGTTIFKGTATSLTLQDGTVTGGAGAITFNLAYNQSGGSFTGGAGTVTVTGAITLSGGTFTGGTTTILTGAATASGGTLNGGSGTLTFNAATFSGATVDGQSAAWNFNGAYTLSAGTFTASSGNTTFALGFTHTAGGTFTHNNGTVVFSGVAATINVTVTETFFNLTINKNTGVALTVAVSDTLVVTGTLTLTDGSLNQGTIPANGSIDAQAGVTHGAGFDGGTGRINITGAAARTINLAGGGSLPGVLLNAANVTLNGPASGTTTFAGTVTSLTLQAGTITGGTGDMTFNLAYNQSGGSFTGGSGTVTVAGAFTLSAGSFTATSGTTTFALGFTHTAGGTFTHNNGTVVFSGAAATINVAVTETFFNVTISKNDGIALTVANNDTLIVTGTLTLTDGSLNQATVPASGSIAARGNITQATTFDGGTGTLVIDSSGVQTFTGSGSTTLGTLPTVTVNKTGGFLTLAGIVRTTNPWTIAAGRVETGTSTLTGTSNFTLSSGATLGIGSIDGITSSGATGNIQVSGIRSFSTGANYIYDGAAAQVTGSGLPATVNNLTINNGAGVTASASTTINGTLTFTSGNVITGSNTILISPTGSVSRTSGHVDGYLGKSVATGATSRTFEVGTGPDFTPVIVAFGNVSVADNLTARSTAGDHPDIANSGVNAAKSVNRYWTLTKGASLAFDSYSATFNFVASDIDAGANPAVFFVAKLDGSTWSWPAVGTRTGTSTQATGMTSFSDYQVGEPSPGVLTNFLVEASGGGSIGTQTAGIAFNLRITARDGFNDTVTSFTGTVDITSTGALSAGGGTTASFTSGVLASHSVTISDTGSFTITATRTGGSQAGTSNAFTVKAPDVIDPRRSVRG